MAEYQRTPTDIPRRERVSQRLDRTSTHRRSRPGKELDCAHTEFRAAVSYLDRDFSTRSMTASNPGWVRTELGDDGSPHGVAQVSGRRGSRTGPTADGPVEAFAMDLQTLSGEAVTSRYVHVIGAKVFVSDRLEIEGASSHFIGRVTIPFVSDVVNAKKHALLRNLPEMVRAKAVSEMTDHNAFGRYTFFLEQSNLLQGQFAEMGRMRPD